MIFIPCKLPFPLKVPLLILFFSQFTLQCVLKGNKPDFHNAMKSEQSQEMYNKFISILKNKLANPNLVQGMHGACIRRRNRTSLKPNQLVLL